MSKARKTAASSGEPDFWRVARDWLHHWLPKVRGSSPKTVEAYRIGLESYVRWLETTEGTQRSHIGFGHFDRARLGRWVEWMRTERGYSDRTIMLRMTTMRVFLDHAGLEHPALTALGNDAAGIRVKPPARKPVDHLGEEHAKALLTAWGTGDAKSRRNRMLLILMYDTAARIGELAALTIADVGMDKPARVTLTGKRGKSRVVPLGERTRTHLAAYLEEFHPGPSMRDGDRPLFHSTRNGAIQPLSVDRIDEILKETQLIEVSDTPARNLTTSAQRMLSLAQALLMDPEVLLIDEPTVGFDVKDAICVRRVIKSLAGKKTVLVATQNLTEAESLCNRVLVMSQGSLRADLPMDRLHALELDTNEMSVRVLGGRDAAEQAVSSVKGAKAVSCEPSRESGAVDLVVEMDEDLRAQLSTALVKAGLPVLEMKRVTVSGEKLLEQLTSEKVGEKGADCDEGNL